MNQIAVVQSLISSEDSIPMDSANIIAICRSQGVDAYFCDLNHKDQLPGNYEVAYLSTYTVVPYSSAYDFPLVLRSIALLRDSGFRKIIVGSRWFNENEISLTLKAGATQVLLGDSATLFQRSLAGDVNPVLELHEFHSLHKIIPDFARFPFGRYRKSILSHQKVSVPVVFSRGCELSCSYCPVKAPVETMTPAEIKNYLSSVLLQTGANHLMIEDDLFNSSAEFVEKFCDLMNSEFPAITWEVLNGLHPANFQGTTWPALTRSRCLHITIGFECFDEEFLKMKNRHYHLESALRGVEVLTKAGIPVSGYFLFDFLLDAPSGLGSQLSGMKRSRITSFHFSSIRALSGREKLLRSISLLYLHLSPLRLIPLYKMGFFSAPYFVRSLKKILG